MRTTPLTLVVLAILACMSSALTSWTVIHYIPSNAPRALTYVFPIREDADDFYDGAILEEDMICVLFLENID